MRKNEAERPDGEYFETGWIREEKVTVLSVGSIFLEQPQVHSLELARTLAQLISRIKTVKRDLISIVVLLAAMNSTATLTVKARSLSGEEEHFAMEAASSGVAEVKLSELAKSRASDGKVKDFAHQMITDHTLVLV